MTNSITLLLIWYIIGMLGCIKLFIAKYNQGDAISLGELLSTFIVAGLGPILWILIIMEYLSKVDFDKVVLQKKIEKKTTNALPYIDHSK